MNQVKQFLDYIFNAVKIFIIVQPWETGIRVRNGKKVKLLSKGIYFRVPYFDSIYIQESRLRIAGLPTQTLTTKDFKSITISSSLGYTIDDIEKLYNTLYHPEQTINNIAMAEAAKLISETESKDLTPTLLEERVLIKLKEFDYGLDIEYFKIINFAIVKTLRLIQDRNWYAESFSMNKKT